MLPVWLCMHARVCESACAPVCVCVPLACVCLCVRLPGVLVCVSVSLAEYQPFVVNITATLVSSGIKAHTLDLTLTHPRTGCYGHPSLADNIEIAAKAKPQIAAVLGWTD